MFIKSNYFGQIVLFILTLMLISFFAGLSTSIALMEPKKEIVYNHKKEIVETRIIYDQIIEENEVSLFQIKCDIYKAKQAITKRKRISTNQIDQLAKVLFVGYKEYGADYKDVLAHIMTESEFKVYAKGYNWRRNKKGKRYLHSIDYGIAQINSKNMKKLYRYSEHILNKYNVKHNVRSKYDISLNVMSAIVYKQDVKRYVKKKPSKYHAPHVQKVVAYNVGMRGSTLKRYIKPARRYYKRYNKFKKLI